ncbi:hypothetical protein BGP_2466 [Beggiatoa sp. PS]|nr:hypothetical protein BGP_2466 [Beggiatoa sp. PS]
MERLMKCALEIIAQLSDGKPVTLLSLEEKHKGIIVGDLSRGN